MSKWAEIRCDFYDDEEKKWFLDAWLTDDDSEEGTVIAKVNHKTKEIEYLDNDAKTDSYAQEIINETLNDINNRDFEK